MRISLVMVMAATLASTTAGAQQPSAGSPPTQGTTKGDQAARPATGDRAAAGDAAFAMKAAQANMAEIELGKLAQQKAQRDDVKQFGQRMVDDHTKALTELKGIAGSKSMALPAEVDAKHKALADRLSKLDGAAFDREYSQAMVDGHKEVAAEFRRQSQSGADAELKAFATKTLPTVEEHLKHAQTLTKQGSSSTR